MLFLFNFWHNGLCQSTTFPDSESGYNLVNKKSYLREGNKNGTSTRKNKVSIKAKVQRLGSTLSSMVMPNIGALIAWGVLTALFIPDGYLPNKAFATMVGPMLTYLIPLLIGYTGGKVIAVIAVP